ncbi:MAG: flippase-like domain-containing protein [Actinomycetia bacterium]|nr:flippase-like domain-containing protein [Actinomycetes bacterium]
MERDITPPWFFVPVDDARARRPIDVALAAFGAFLVFVTILEMNQIRWFEDFLGQIVELLPSWLETAFTVTYAAGLVFSLLILAMAASQWSKRPALIRDLAVAGLLAFGLLFVLTRLVSGEWPIFFPELFSLSEPRYPVARVVLVAAVLVVAGPQLVRPLRRVGWLILVLIFFIAIALGYGLPGDAIGGLGVGLLSGSLVLVFFGSARGFPSRIGVREGLGQLGIEIDDVTVADYQSWGARQFDCTTFDGDFLRVRAYGRDAENSQTITRWWRSVWYRDSGPALTSSRLHMVEHQALLTIEAQRVGVSVQDVLAVGEPTDETAFLALSARGTPIRDLGDGEVGDDVLTNLWESVGLLHQHGISHGRLNENAIRIDGSHAVLENFHAASTVAPDDRIQGDVTELLASLSNRFGAERAVAVARDGLGNEALIEALPYMQRSAVSTEGRKLLPSKKVFFVGIREEVAAQTGVELPKPAQLTRISWRSIFMFGLTALAAYALVGALVGIDFVAVWEELQSAKWGWIFVALIFATATLFSDAFTMMAAVSAPIPLRPTVQLQSSIKFIQLAIGGAAGRMATNVAYLRKFGVSAAASVTQGGVDSLTGFIIQIAILVLAIVFGNFDLIPDDASVDIEWVLVLGLLLFAIIVSALMFRFVPAIRNKVIPPAKQMWDGLRELAADPSRLVRLFGANLASQLLFGFSLWLTALAFGWVLPYMSVVVIYVAMALLSGILPIPGGVGVSEAVLTAGLVAIGVDESAAFAIAVTFRVLSAYLPPVWGWFSLQWLQRNEYL